MFKKSNYSIVETNHVFYAFRIKHVFGNKMIYETDLMNIKVIKWEII